MKARKLIILAVLVILLAAPVYASMVDDMLAKIKETSAEAEQEAAGKGVVVNFYNDYRTIIDFFVMFMLFTAIAYFGLKKFAGDEKGQAAKAIALAVGLALAFAAIKAGISATFFGPFVKNFLFLVMFFVVFMILRKLTGDTKVFWPMVFALLLTFAAFNFTEIVFDEDKKFNFANMLSLTPTATEIDDLQADMREYLDDLKAVGARHFNDRERRIYGTLSNFTSGDFYVVYNRIVEAIIEEQYNVSRATPPDENKLKALDKDLNTIQGLYEDYQDAEGEIRLLRHNLKPRDFEVTLTGGDVSQPLVCSTTPAVARQRRGAEESGATFPPPEYDFRWFKKGVEVTDLKVEKTENIRSELPARYTNVGEQWYCEVEAYIYDESSEAKSNTVTIVAADTPGAQPQELNVNIVRVNPASGDLAVGLTLELRADVSGGTEPYTYQWVEARGYPISGAKDQQTVTYRFEQEGTHTLRVSVRDSQGRQGSATLNVEVRAREVGAEESIANARNAANSQDLTQIDAAIVRLAGDMQETSRRISD